MKKVLLLGVAISALTFIACKKSKKNEETDIFALSYSNLSVEEQKKQIEQSGVEFISKVNTLPEEQSVQTLSYLSELNLPNPSGVVKSLESIAIASQQKNASGILEATAKVSADTLKRLNSNYGIYNWNRNRKQWDYTASSTRLEYQFPATEESTTNNATLNITFTASNARKPVDGGYAELPATINASLKINNKEELKYTSSYEYTSGGMPNKANIDVVMGSFTIKYNASNATNEAGTSFVLSKSDETLIAWSVSASGNLNLDQDDETIVNNANATFQIMNIKLAGQADFKAISDGEKGITDTSSFQANKKKAELYNNNTKFVAVNAKENKAIAKLEFVADPGLNSRLVFKDGSKQSFDEFFATGFDDFLGAGL